MRIVVNDIAASCGGALSILKDFYNYIKDNDTENEWIFLLSDFYIEETANIKVRILPEVKKNAGKKLLFDFVTGKKYIQKLNPDVVFSMQNIITFGLETPQITYIHQSIPFQDIQRFSFLKKNEFKIAIYQYIIGDIIKKSVKKADKVIVQTKWMKKAIHRKVGVLENKIINILPNMEDVSKYKKNNSFKCNQFFYPTTGAVYKNNRCIYKACELLGQKGYHEFLVKLTIADNNEKNNIQFIGRIPREQVIEEYNQSTLVFPSYIETYGYPLAEARQMGTIVLASDCPFSREVLEGYENAYYFDPFKPEELAELMEKVMSGEIQRKETVEIINSVNSWETVVKEVVST